MQAVLWDMMRADQFLGDFLLKKDSNLDKTTERIKLYRQVFAIHDIRKEQFAESFSFYKTHPSLFKIIMDSISQPKPEAPTEMIRPFIRPDSFQQPPRIPPLADSVIQWRRKKTLKVS